MNNEILDKIGTRIGQISDLPKEMQEELEKNKSLVIENQIKEIIKELDGVANIDEIYVHFYRKYNVVEKRKYLLSKLYRMIKSKTIYTVKGKKGAYSLTKLD